MNAPSQWILAIDLGTSGCKAALVSVDGEVAAWEFQSVETILLPGGGAEQDPHAWWSALVSVSRRLVARHPDIARAVVAVCCSTQGEGTVAVDRDGKALMNAVLWMDARGADHLRKITHGPVRVAGYDARRLWRWIRLTGGAPSLAGKDPAAHMLFVRHERPQVYERTHKFLNVLDYLNLRLTGRFVATHDSILTSWVTDNRGGSVSYDDLLVRRSGIDADKFPDIVACTETLGPLRAEVSAELGLPPTVMVVAGAIDTSAAAVGSGAVRDYDTHLYIGTSSWLGAHLPRKKTDLVSAMAAVPCAIAGRYLLTGLQATAGGNLTFLRDRILYHKDELLQEAQVPDVFQVIDRIAEKTPAGSNGVIYTPWIYGERAPVEDRHVRAAIYNLSLENSREDIIRAVLEGVALNTRWLLSPFEKVLGRATGPIHMVGGGANSPVWCRIFADVLRRPVRRMKDPIQANVRGAAFIGAVGLGLIRFDEVPARVRCVQEYEPDAGNGALYDERFAQFVRIYRANRGVYARLNARR
ncbi:MAG TPA: FGGY-family carbohydrate kinase [Candidatus Limnocylindrales bacterium]|nr:FGGY-family carbohydrate kinase [Candidatus Limnocylindrales bacterium]